MTEPRAPRVFLQPREARMMSNYLRRLGPDFVPAADALRNYATTGMAPDAGAAWAALRNLPEPVIRAIELQWGYRQ